MLDKGVAQVVLNKKVKYLWKQVLGLIDVQAKLNRDFNCNLFHVVLFLVLLFGVAINNHFQWLFNHLPHLLLQFPFPPFFFIWHFGESSQISVVNFKTRLQYRQPGVMVLIFQFFEVFGIGQNLSSVDSPTAQIKNRPLMLNNRIIEVHYLFSFVG
jgi:hypothetical protein